MFYLHLSNRTENLLAQLVVLLKDQPRDDLFAKEIFLVQSQGMERMLSQRLADALGVWCNFEYLLPTHFFDLMAARLCLKIHPDAYHRETLTWRIDSLLHQAQQAPEPLFAPVLHYINGEQGDLKRFQLARQLANLYDQYQVMRPEMLDGWQEQALSGKNPAESWQMALWRRLRASLPDSPHRGEMLRQFLHRMHTGPIAPTLLPARLSVFGLHSLPPLLLDCLHGISRHCDIHFFLLSPCRNYWADLPGQRQLLHEDRKRIHQGLSPLFLAPEIHPLLTSLGRQGRDFQAMLLDRIDSEHLQESEDFADPALPEGEAVVAALPSLLHRLQSDLLDGGWQEKAPGVSCPADSSLVFSSCHSAAQEMVALKDQILFWLQENPDMGLADIVVMAPDIQEYSAIIPAIFHDIQHSIADRSLHRQNNGVAIFFQFLDLAVSRCPWSAVLDLLEKPEIAFACGGLSLSDLEMIRHWVVGAGIRWGIAGDEPQGEKIPELADISWQAGLDRLLLGYAMDWQQPVCFAGDGGTNEILPYPDIEGGQAAPLGGLCQFIELLERAGSAMRQPQSLTDWSALLLALAQDLFGEGQEAVLAPLREILLSLRAYGDAPAPAVSAPDRVLPGTGHQHSVPLEVIRDWLENTASESRSSAGFLRGALSFCSMLPMRSIPFRAICLLGLNDGVFPATDRHPPFDLMGERGRPGDRSRRSDDRYQFLEAMLAARHYLYLSWVGQSIRSGKSLPPSVVVTELIETLALSYGLSNPVRRHPLHPFSPDYFRGQSLFSFNAHNCEVAQALSSPTPPADSPLPWWTGDLPAEPLGPGAGGHGKEPVGVTELLAFFANPQKWFVRHRLDISLEPESDLPEEHELFAVSGLDAYQVNQDLLQASLVGEGVGNEEESSRVLRALTAQGRWMLGMPGQLAFSRKNQEAQELVARIRNLSLGQKLPDRPLDLVVGDFHLTGQLGGRYENGILLARPSACKGKDLLRAWIRHLLATAACPERPVITHLLSQNDDFCFPPTPEPLPFLVQALAIFAQGRTTPSPLLVEPAWVFVQQLHKPRARKTPWEAALGSLRTTLEKGHDPELTLLYGECDPASLLGPAFVELCTAFVAPIFMAGRRSA